MYPLQTENEECYSVTIGKQNQNNDSLEQEKQRTLNGDQKTPGKQQIKEQDSHTPKEASERQQTNKQGSCTPEETSEKKLACNHKEPETGTVNTTKSGHWTGIPEGIPVLQLTADELKGFQIVNMSAAAMLYDWRIRHQMTQQEVAKRAGISQQEYQRFETGKRDLMRSSFAVTCKILKALGMNIEKFYEGEYVFGGEIYFDKEGQTRYVETGRLLNENQPPYDEEEEIKSMQDCKQSRMEEPE